MARVCEICGKRPSVGHKIKRRGLAKKKGGVGRKITGKTKRRFLPNLQTVKVKWDGGTRKMRVCTQCIRSDKVEKAI